MKKILFVAAMGLAFAACSSKSDTASSESAAQVAEETVAQAEAPEAVAEVKIDTVGYTTTASGLKYKEIKAGNGAQPTASDVVKVHYTGKHLDGNVFDSSVERGEPTSFPLGQVIPGWTEGVQLMKEGSKYQFIIPAGLAYGERGAGPIKPGETLYFEVELLEVEK